MGWTGTHASYYKNGKVDRKRECDEMSSWETDKYINTLLKSSMVGSVYYAAIETINKETQERKVWAEVILTTGQDRSDPYFNFHYKELSEDAGPGEYKCPKGILKLLTPTDSEYAKCWRERCHEYHANKKKKSWLKELEIGKCIKYTRYNGEELILRKHPPAYQFKTWFWYDINNGTYVSKKYVNENNSVPYVA